MEEKFSLDRNEGFNSLVDVKIEEESFSLHDKIATEKVIINQPTNTDLTLAIEVINSLPSPNHLSPYDLSVVARDVSRRENVSEYNPKRDTNEVFNTVKFEDDYDQEIVLIQIKDMGTFLFNALMHIEDSSTLSYWNREYIFTGCLDKLESFKLISLSIFKAMSQLHVESLLEDLRNDPNSYMAFIALLVNKIIDQGEELSTIESCGLNLESSTYLVFSDMEQYRLSSEETVRLLSEELPQLSTQ